MVRCGARSEASRWTRKTKIIVATTSARQAATMSTLLKVALPCFVAGPSQEFGVNRRAARRSELRFFAPITHHEPDQDQREDWQQDRHDPGEKIETFFGRFDEDGGAVLSDVGGHDFVIGLIFGDAIIEISLHAAGGFAGTGEGAAGMAAQAGGIFAAAAHAFHAVGELFRARGLLGEDG